MRLIGVALLSAGLLASASPAVRAAGDNSPRWRGPSGRRASDGAGFPAASAPGTNIAFGLR